MDWWSGAGRLGTQGAARGLREVGLDITEETLKEERWVSRLRCREERCSAGEDVSFYPHCAKVACGREE
jgi:hypothetical protein